MKHVKYDEKTKAKMLEKKRQQIIKLMPAGWECPEFLGDFELEPTYDSFEEEQEAFAVTRLHGIGNKVHPFAIGGSEVGNIYGIGIGATPSELYDLKLGLIEPRPISSSLQKIFDAGHLAEDFYRDVWFPRLSGYKAIPWTIQARLPKYPHCVANIDGLVLDKDGKVGLYEGKTTGYYYGNHTRQIWEAGNIPLYNEYQMRFYMEIWDLDFGCACCGWGIREDDIKWKRIERDRELGQEIMETCEQFVQNAVLGIRPTDADADVDMQLEAIKRKYPADENAPMVRIDKSFEATCREIDNVNSTIINLQRTLDMVQSEIKDDVKLIEDKIKREKERKATLTKALAPEMKSATQGELTVGNECWRVQFEESSRPKFDAEVKNKLATKYPAAWKDCFEDNPKNRNIKITKVSK